MKRGEIYYADLNPVVGSEIAKRRPVLIVSNNANNRAASTVTVVPLTSQVSRVYPFEVLLARLLSSFRSPVVIFRVVRLSQESESLPPQGLHWPEEEAVLPEWPKR